jgi:hypothetical protein
MKTQEMEVSDTIGMNEIGFLLSKIQNEIKVQKNQWNAFGKYKYRSVEDIQVALKPIMLKYESIVILTDETFELCGIPVVRATAKFICPFGEIHVSADAGVDVHQKGMNYAQAFGSSSSYARKYALGGLLLLDDTKDSDTTNDHNKNEIKVLTDAQVKSAIEKGNNQKVLDGNGSQWSLTETQIKLLNAKN